MSPLEIFDLIWRVVITVLALSLFYYCIQVEERLCNTSNYATSAYKQADDLYKKYHSIMEYLGTKEFNGIVKKDNSK